MNGFELRMLSFHLDNMIVHVEFVEGFLAILVGFDSGFKKLVVEKTCSRNILFKGVNLPRSRIQPVSEHSLCRKHDDIYFMCPLYVVLPRAHEK